LAEVQLGTPGTVPARTDPVPIGRDGARRSVPATNDKPQIIQILAPGFKNITITAMKFALAILVFLLMAAVLCAGILALIAGKPLLLIVGVVGFVLLFAKYGCLSH
jgi:hypothetical protein